MRTEDHVASSPASFYASLPAPVNSSDREFQSPMPDHGEIKQGTITTFFVWTKDKYGCVRIKYFYIQSKKHMDVSYHNHPPLLSQHFLTFFSNFFRSVMQAKEF